MFFYIRATHVTGIFIAGLLMATSAFSQTVESMKQDFKERKQAYVAEYLKTRFKIPKLSSLRKGKKDILFSRSFNQKTSTRALVQMAENHDLVKANELLQKVCQFYLDCDVVHLTNPDSFYWATRTYFHLYHKFSSRGRDHPGRMTPETEALFLKMMWRFLENSDVLTPMALIELSYKKDGYYYKNSENHWFAEIVTLWGFCEIMADLPAYKDRKLPQGKTVSEMATYLSDYLKVYLRGRASKGFLTEVAANGYNSIMTALFASLQDYAKDARLREMGRDMQDLYWAFWAEEQVAGERGGGKVRQRSWYGLTPNKGMVSSNIWLYFGLGEPKSYFYGSYSVLNNIYCSYVPRDMVYKILLASPKAAPYEIIHRRIARRASDMPKEKTKLRYYAEKGFALRYSWREKDFILGTIMRPPLAAEEWPPGSMQSWHHGLIIDSIEQSDRKAERVIPKVLQADTFNEQYSVQSKGTIICRHLPHEQTRKVPMGVFISKGLLPHLTHEKHDKHGKHDIFIEYPKAHVAIRSVASSFTEHDISSIKELDGLGSYFKIKDKFAPVIIEVANPKMFKSFKAFKTKVLSQEAKIEDGQLTYVSIYGDKLTMKLKPEKAPLINAKKINYHPEFVYKSPFIQSKHGSGIIKMTDGTDSWKLNFNF